MTGPCTPKSLLTSGAWTHQFADVRIGIREGATDPFINMPDRYAGGRARPAGEVFASGRPGPESSVRHAGNSSPSQAASGRHRGTLRHFRKPQGPENGQGHDRGDDV